MVLPSRERDLGRWLSMKLFNNSTLRAIRESLRDNAGGQQSLENWRDMLEAADWSCHDDLVTKATHSPDPVGGDRVVFNILNNDFRLVVRVDYDRRWVFLHWFGTHREYDQIDVRTVPRNLRSS